MLCDLLLLEIFRPMALPFLHRASQCIFFLFDSIFSLTPFLLSVEWHMISTFICDWVLCVPHRYYYCFPINVGEQSISIVIHPHRPPPTFCSVSLSIALTRFSFFLFSLLFDAQKTQPRYGSLCIFSASTMCMCSNVTEQK